VSSPSPIPVVAPVVAIGAIAFDDDGRVLLVQRAGAPGAGLWTVPGGKLQFGETLIEGVAREVREETGLDVEVRDLITVVERVNDGADGADPYHYVIHDYLVRATGGTLAAGDDAADARWVAEDELAELPLTAGLVEVLDIARQLR